MIAKIIFCFVRPYCSLRFGIRPRGRCLESNYCLFFNFILLRIVFIVSFSVFVSLALKSKVICSATALMNSFLKRQPFPCARHYIQYVTIVLYHYLDFNINFSIFSERRFGLLNIVNNNSNNEWLVTRVRVVASTF